MVIYGLPTDLGGPGCYRVTFPLDELGEHGHECFTPPFTTRPAPPMFGRPQVQLRFDFSTASHMDGDLYIVQKPWEPDYAGLIRLLADHGKNVVVDVDDVFWQVPFGHAGHGRLVERAQAGLDALRSATAITVSTSQLAEELSDLGPPVYLLENRLRWAMWQSGPAAFELDRPRVRVGWFGSVPYRDPGDLKVLVGVIGPWLETRPDVDFVAAGDGAIHDILGVPDGQRVTVPGCDLRHLPAIVRTIDIGLVPLAPGVFNAGKSWLKGLEYAAAGVACIASPSQPYVELAFKVPIMLASKPQEWRYALDCLVEDDARRSAAADAHRAVQELTIERGWQEWANVYGKVAGCTTASTSGSGNGSAITS
jgi:hypothetical protein